MTVGVTSERTLLRDRVYARLRDSIVRGDLAPGTQLRDDVLSKQYGTSRTPVREALLRLERAGLVHSVPGRATVVAPENPQRVRWAQQVAAELHALAVTLCNPEVVSVEAAAASQPLPGTSAPDEGAPGTGRAGTDNSENAEGEAAAGSDAKPGAAGTDPGTAGAGAGSDPAAASAADSETQQDPAVIESPLGPTELGWMKSANASLAMALEAGDARAAIEADTEFHRIPVRACGNLVIADQLEQISAQLHRAEYLHFGRLTGLDSPAQHDKILKALAKGKYGRAAKLTRENWLRLA